MKMHDKGSKEIPTNFTEIEMHDEGSTGRTKSDSNSNSTDNSFNSHLAAGNYFRPLSSQIRPGSSLRPGSSIRPMSKAASFRKGSRTPGLRLKTPSTARPPPTREGELSYAVIGLATVLHDFEAEEFGDLTLKAGTVVQVVEKEDLWWRGKYDGGEIGLFPSNFVETIAATEQLAEINRKEWDRMNKAKRGGGGGFDSFKSNPRVVKEDEERESEVGSVGGGESKQTSPTNKNGPNPTSHRSYEPPAPKGLISGPGPNALSSAVMTASIKPCDRHGLTSCVLCSLNLSQPGFAQWNPSQGQVLSMTYGGSSGAQSLSPINKAASTNFEFSQAVNQSKPCERHFLMNCVLCSGKYQSDSQPQSTNSSPLKPLVNVGGGVDLSGAKCERHNLRDCFLCSLQSTGTPQQPVSPQQQMYNQLKMSPSHSKFNASYGLLAPDTAGSDYPSSPMGRNSPAKGGLTLTSIPYSASTSFQPHSSESVFMGPSQSPSGLSPSIHSTPVSHPTQSHPIRMDRYQFGEGPPLALGMTTSRSIASPGNSSTYSAAAGSEVRHERGCEERASKERSERAEKPIYGISKLSTEVPALVKCQEYTPTLLLTPAMHTSPFAEPLLPPARS